MIAFFRTPARRIALAIALSALIHAIVLWLPYMQLPQARVQLPPLSVRLEPLPKPVEATPQLAKQVPAVPLLKSENNTTAKLKNNAMAAMERTEEPASAQTFPKHLQLKFVVYKGAGGPRTGDIIQQLDIRKDRYTLKSMRQTSGLASLSSSDRTIQTSLGKIVKTGLQPEIFEEQNITRDGTQDVQARFDWLAGKLRYSTGADMPLPADAQDSLSYLYQLSQMRMNGEFFPLPVSNGTQLQQYRIEIGTNEDIDTPMGRMPALHLRKMHAHGEPYFEIWLGLEYRLLPVKFSQVDNSGNVAEEFVISSIRADDQ